MTDAGWQHGSEDGAANAAGPTVHVGNFHADPEAVRLGDVVIPVAAATGWTTKLSHRSVSVNGSDVRNSMTLLFCVTGPEGARIEYRPTSTGTTRTAADQRKELEALGARLQDYGIKVLSKPIVEKLARRVVAGEELDIGSVRVGAAGLSTGGRFGGRKTLSWSDYHSTGINNGNLFPKARDPKSGKARLMPFAKIDLEEDNAIVLPGLLLSLRRYYVKA